MKASDCKCIVCGKKAVAFWPIIDPDIPEYPYCRKCLDEAKIQLIMGMFKVNADTAKKVVKYKPTKARNKK